MVRKTFLISIQMLLMLLSTTAPAFATPPQKGLYTQVIIDHTTVPGEDFATGDVLHLRGMIGECYLYAVSFPLGNSISNSYTGRGQLNLVSLTGSMIGHSLDAYAAGTVAGLLNIKFTGGGVYVYTGPTFTFTLGGVTATLTTEDMFAGLLYEGFAVKHGTGDLAGFTMEGTATGVTIMDVIVGDPSLVGFGLSLETGRYSVF